MKTERMYLDELNPSSMNFTVKVKVVEKARQKISSNARATVFQTLYLLDEKNNKLRVTLFGDQIKAYDEVIAYNGEYEISNATVKPLDDQYRTVHDQLPFQLHFSHRTVVQPVCPDTGYVVPKYQSIASIPRVQVADERYDVLGVVLFVEEEARQVNSKYNNQSYVREIVIIDQTHNQTLIISAWNDLALNFWAERFHVVGFTALKHNPRRAFALSTSMSTRIIHNPNGDRANVLREWAVERKQLLQDRQARVLQIRDPTQEQSMKTIEELNDKKAANALMEERHWIQAIIPNATLDDVFVYIGCSGCGKRCSVLEGRQFTYIVCDNKDCISIADVTGSITLTSINNDTEKLFEKAAAEIKTMKDLADVVAFQTIEERLGKNTTFFKLGPSNSLGSSSVLEWSLKTIENAEDASKKDLSKSTVARDDEIEFSDLNMNVDYTSNKFGGSASVGVEQDAAAIGEDTPDSKAKDKGKGKLSHTTTLKFPLSHKGKNPNTGPVKSQKISHDEWAQLCRTCMSGSKQSPDTPAHNEDKRTDSIRVKTVARKKLCFTTSPYDENADHDSATKNQLLLQHLLLKSLIHQPMMQTQLHQGWMTSQLTLSPKEFSSMSFNNEHNIAR
uniref:Uncharacterized protein n=1 Tax=Chenopodium quinoa TaxID=63459 RepID=A0A803MDU2_CHEQI